MIIFMQLHKYFLNNTTNHKLNVENEKYILDLSAVKLKIYFWYFCSKMKDIL